MLNQSFWTGSTFIVLFYHYEANLYAKSKFLDRFYMYEIQTLFLIFDLTVKIFLCLDTACIEM